MSLSTTIWWPTGPRSPPDAELRRPNSGVAAPAGSSLSRQEFSRLRPVAALRGAPDIRIACPVLQLSLVSGCCEEAKMKSTAKNGQESDHFETAMKQDRFPLKGLLLLSVAKTPGSSWGRSYLIYFHSSCIRSDNGRHVKRGPRRGTLALKSRPVLPVPQSCSAPTLGRDKWLGGFYFDLNPNINPATVHTLATGDWIRKAAPLCLIHDSGTGKSHLLIGFGTAKRAATSAAASSAPSPATSTASWSPAPPNPRYPITVVGMLLRAAGSVRPRTNSRWMPT
ncbi:hypothetical protein QF036_002313 [Arthrobacter globiformis]|nr:hypothetical protein [Arthrobacter globiformis]